MPNEMWKGVIMVIVAGLVTGGGGWPIKLYRKFKYEQWGFLGAILGLVILPWGFTVVGCHGFSNTIAVVGEVLKNNWGDLIKGNLIAACWGVANVLCALCFVRIGFALTAGILTGLGMSTGVLLPMVLKGSGVFQDAPDINSKPGLVVVVAVAVMLTAVLLVVLAGLGKDRVLKKAEMKSGGRLENPIDFYAGLTMAIVMGILSAGLGLSYVYSQGPITATMEKHGAASWSTPYAMLAMGAALAILMNLVYPAYLMTKNKTWGVLLQCWTDMALLLVTGVQAVLTFPLMFLGMKTLGPIGASVGFGIQQCTQMIGSQIVGFVSGEWRGVKGRPRMQMYLAILVLMIAVVILAYGKTLSNQPG